MSLFLRDFVEGCLQIEVEGRKIPVNRAFLREILSRPPCDLETIHFRQDVVRELEADAELLEKTRTFYAQIYQLLSMFMAWPERARLDPTVFRLEILESSRAAVDFMASEFSGARSGLNRLCECGAKRSRSRRNTSC